MKQPSIQEIKDAYRIAALKYHPDRIPLKDPSRKLSEIKFGQVTTAYKELLQHYAES
jgi:DnaJ-class molecular chaperone